MDSSGNAIPTPWSPLITDVNGDGQFTITDVGLWLSEAFFLPGDWLIWLASEHAPVVAGFLELSNVDYGGVLSGWVSAATWFALFIGYLIVLNFLRRFDRGLTHACIAVYRESRRRLRVFWASLAYRLRSSKQAPSSDAIEFTEELELDEREMRILKAHADVEPPYVLAFSDIARTVGIDQHELVDIVQRLKRLQLLEGSLAGADGAGAYMLTQSGRAYLVFQQLQ